MIATLTGKVESTGGESCIIDVNGVGYRVFMPLTNLEEISRSDKEVKIYTYFHLREDGASLFGFLSLQDKMTFEKIIGVSGIGPKTALAILGAFTAAEFSEIIHEEDHRALTGVSGVGLKTAQRLILELKGKLVTLSPGPEAGSKNYFSSRSQVGDAVDALVALGYPQKEASGTVEGLLAGDKSLTTPELVRKALQQLGRK